MRVTVQPTCSVKTMGTFLETMALFLLVAFAVVTPSAHGRAAPPSYVINSDATTEGQPHVVTLPADDGDERDVTSSFDDDLPDLKTTPKEPIHVRSNRDDTHADSAKSTGQKPHHFRGRREDPWREIVFVFGLVLLGLFLLGGVIVFHQEIVVKWFLCLVWSYWDCFFLVIAYHQEITKCFTLVAERFQHCRNHYKFTSLPVSSSDPQKAAPLWPIRDVRRTKF